MTRHAWGNTWQRPNIDLRTRSIVTVAMLVALGRMHELKIHLRGALNNGVTQLLSAAAAPLEQAASPVAGGARPKPTVDAPAWSGWPSPAVR